MSRLFSEMLFLWIKTDVYKNEGLCIGITKPLIGLFFFRLR